MFLIPYLQLKKVDSEGTFFKQCIDKLTDETQKQSKLKWINILQYEIKKGSNQTWLHDIEISSNDYWTIKYIELKVTGK